jgi:carbon storage regulator
MLILSRKTSESIIIDGRILIKIVRIEGGMVKVGIDAPVSIPVHRQEVFEEIQRNNLEAMMRNRPPLPQLDLSSVSLAQAAKPSHASGAAGKSPKETEPAARSRPNPKARVAPSIEGPA